MRLTSDTFEVSEDFVRWALELAFKKVYENRREQHKNASETVRDAIEMRYDMMWTYIDNVMESYSFSIDPYDDVDSRFAWDEYTYEEIWKDEILPTLDEDEIKELGVEWTDSSDQNEKLSEWCMDNYYWKDDSYEIVVQDPFNLQ